VPAGLTGTQRAALELQRTVGNAAGSQLIAQLRDTPETVHDLLRQTGQDLPVQRYAVVLPGTDSYPVAGPTDEQGNAPNDLFPAQEKVGGSFVTDGQPNMRPDGGLRPLRISDKLDLAIEHIEGYDAEAKTFFATEERIEKANSRLKGIISLRATEKYLQLQKTRRFLRIEVGTSS